MEYEIVLKVVFKNKVPNEIRHVPLFIGDTELTVEEAIKSPVLNLEGISAIKRILKCLQNISHSLSFNPMIL